MKDLQLLRSCEKGQSKWRKGKEKGQKERSVPVALKPLHRRLINLDVLFVCVPWSLSTASSESAM